MSFGESTRSVESNPALVQSVPLEVGENFAWITHKFLSNSIQSGSLDERVNPVLDRLFTRIGAATSVKAFTLLKLEEQFTGITNTVLFNTSGPDGHKLLHKCAILGNLALTRHLLTILTTHTLYEAEDDRDMGEVNILCQPPVISCILSELDTVRKIEMIELFAEFNHVGAGKIYKAVRTKNYTVYDEGGTRKVLCGSRPLTLSPLTVAVMVPNYTTIRKLSELGCIHYCNEAPMHKHFGKTITDALTMRGPLIVISQLSKKLREDPLSLILEFAYGIIYKRPTARGGAGGS